MNKIALNVSAIKQADLGIIKQARGWFYKWDGQVSNVCVCVGG